eukprot:2192998-Rhodomonas_salina.3
MSTSACWASTTAMRIEVSAAMRIDQRGWKLLVPMFGWGFPSSRSLQMWEPGMSTHPLPSPNPTLAHS